jgi:hypothetical protein
MFADPGGGAVGGTLVLSGVGEVSGVRVAESLVGLGVDAARSVSCAATVCATDVAMTESFDAGAQLLNTSVKQITAAKVR